MEREVDQSSNGEGIGREGEAGSPTRETAQELQENEAEGNRPGREVTQSSHTDGIPQENEAGSPAREPVEKLQENDAEIDRLGREVPESSNANDIPEENEAGSHTREPVEELQRKQEEYEVWRSPFDCQETLEYLRGENRNQQKSLDVILMEMKEDDAKLIGEAVASHPFLEVLTIKLDSIHEEQDLLSSPTSMWPMDSFLQAAFLREERNTSVSSLIVASSQTDGDIFRLGLLPQVLRENTRIRQLSIQWSGDDGASLEETHDLFEALQSNSTIEFLALPNLEWWDFPEPEYQGFIHASTFRKMLNLVERNTSIQKLQIHIGECRPNTEVNLDAFYGALTSNSTIRSLHLTGPFYTQVAERAFSNWIKTTLTLKELRLEGEYFDDESSILKVLVEALPDNRSLQTLHLDLFYSLDDHEILSKLEELGAGGHPTIQEIFLDSKVVRDTLKGELSERSLES